MVRVGSVALMGFTQKNSNHHVQEVLDGIFNIYSVLHTVAVIFWTQDSMAIKSAFAKYYPGIFFSRNYDFQRHSLDIGCRNTGILAGGRDGDRNRSGNRNLEHP